MIHNKHLVNGLRQIYPAGTRIRLIRMQDPYPVLSGTEGTVVFIDDFGQIHMNWDNGSTLAIQADKDKFEVIKER